MTSSETSTAPIEFFVPGIPQPGGSKRPVAWLGSDGRLHARAIEDARRNAPWRAAVALAAAEAYGGPPLEGPLRLRVAFRMPRPAGHLGARGLRPSAPEWPTKRPDLTKLVRATEDALMGILWNDDAQVVELQVSKYYTQRSAGADVHVSSLGVMQDVET